MRLAILGAGAIGPACATLAVSRGHAAVLWSPSGAGTRGLDGSLRAEGALEGRFAVAVAAGLEEAFAGARRLGANQRLPDSCACRQGFIAPP